MSLENAGTFQALQTNSGRGGMLEAFSRWCAPQSGWCGMERGKIVAMKDNKLTKFLVACFGLYQLGHFLSNVIGSFTFLRTGEVPFPALPPTGGWPVDMMHVFVDMASMDTLNAAVSLVFVWGYYAGKPWRLWLGTITLTLSVYAAILFNLSAYQAGAWAGANLWPYVFINVTYIPVVVLYVMVLGWGAKYFRKGDQ